MSNPDSAPLPPDSAQRASAASDGNSARHRVAPWWATGALLLVLLAGLGVLFGVQKAQKRVSVDVLELLPRDEQDPTIRLARQTVSGRFGRTMLIALSDRQHRDKAPTEAAAKMAAALNANPVFNGAFSGLADGDKERMGQWFFQRRLSLRLPFWLDAMRARWLKEKGPNAGDPDVDWLANAAASDLQDFQNTPDALAAQELLPRDPLLLIPGLLAIFSEDDKSTAGEVAGGAMTGLGEDGTRYALIYAEIKAPPLEEAGQKPVFEALDREFEAARTASGADLALRYSGVNRFAAESRSRAQSEIEILTNISLIASCVLLFTAFRRVGVFIYLLLPIITATVWSMVVCFAVFERVHVVTVIFTTVLVGVALDYGIYTLTHAQKTVGGMAQAMREIRWPLIAGCLTSVGGFIFMTLTSLPMLQQMGLAVALGLIFSLTLDFLYLPWLPTVQLGHHAERRSRRLTLEGPLFPTLALGMVLACSALVYFAHVRWNDDIRTLQTMPPELQKEEESLRKLFGQSKSERIVITFGNDLTQAFANLDTFNAVLAAHSAGPGERFFNLGRILPTPEQTTHAREYFRAHGQFAASLRRALDAGFNADAFAPFWGEWETYMAGVNDPHQAAPNIGQTLNDLRSVLPLPLHNLWNDENAGSAWIATRISASLYAKLPATSLKAPNAAIDQVETLNGALTRYRLMATQRAGVGLAVITICVLLAYGWRRGAFMLVVPAIGILVTVAVLGFLGQSLGLLHVVALLLGFCLSSDYAIFLASPGDLPNSTRRAIRLAATTALLGFGVLSFSKINALHDICLTVTLVIGCVLVLCELSHWLFVRVASGRAES